NIKRKPDDVESRAQLARIAMRSGRAELGQELYEAALRNAAGKQNLQRAVAWNYGWDLYRAGQPGQALKHWSGLVGGWPGTPAWQPPTYALALWTVGRRDQAGPGYAAAGRADPRRGGDPRDHPDAR